MALYTCKIHNDRDADAFTQMIQVGSYVLTFNFQWAIVSEEQYTMILRYLNNKASNDPLVMAGNYVRNYDWFEYYNALKNKNLDEWLDSNPLLPVSLSGKARSEQKRLLNIYLTEMLSLEPVVLLYKDILKWQFTATGPGIDTTVGYVQPGGWYHNQDSVLSFRFISELDKIDRDTISEVTIQFEVYNE